MRYTIQYVGMTPQENLQFAKAISDLFSFIPWATDADWEWHDDVWGRTIGRCEVCYSGLGIDGDGNTYCPVPERHKEG